MAGEVWRGSRGLGIFRRDGLIRDVPWLHQDLPTSSLFLRCFALTSDNSPLLHPTLCTASSNLFLEILLARRARCREGLPTRHWLGDWAPSRLLLFEPKVMVLYSTTAGINFQPWWNRSQPSPACNQKLPPEHVSRSTSFIRRMHCLVQFLLRHNVHASKRYVPVTCRFR